MEYDDLIRRKKIEYGDKFDASDLNPDFIPYFNNGERVEVDFGSETKRGTIGVSTGWKPIFLLILTQRSMGSSWTIGKTDKIIKVIH